MPRETTKVPNKSSTDSKKTPPPKTATKKADEEIRKGSLPHGKNPLGRGGKKAPMGRFLRAWNKSRKRKNTESDENEGVAFTGEEKLEKTQSPHSVLPELTSVDEKKKATVVSEDKGDSKMRDTNMLRWTVVGIAMVAMAVGLVVFSSSLLNCICAPAFPGYKLSAGSNDVYIEAPWWAPMSYKSRTFLQVCGKDRTRTAVEWVPFDKKKNFNRLKLISLDGENASVVHREKWRLSSVCFHFKCIVAIDSEGQEVAIPAPWMIATE